jgi:uncharacterized membrane protein
MGFGAWWKRSSGTKKTVTLFATILILQMGLCFSTDYWMPVYEHVTGQIHESEAGLGLVIMQAFLCGLTVVIFVVVLIYVLLNRKTHVTDSKDDSNEEKS